MIEESSVENSKNLDAGDVIILDSYNLMYRSYHATKPLSAPDGTPTNAVFTMLRILLSVEKAHGKNNIRFGFAVFDGGGNNFRKEIDSEYKANRKEMPDDLKPQVPLIKELCTILGWKVFTPEGVEADDWAGSVALRASKKFKTYIYSSDKDFYAIVDENIKVVDGKSKIQYGREEIFEKIGVYPENIVGYLALMGDGVDNVIGIEKCGPKTAVKWLNEYKDINGVIANADKVTGVAGENLRKSIESGQLSKNLELVQMKLDLDIQITVKESRKDPIDQKRLEDFCRKLGFESFLPENKAQYQAAVNNSKNKPS